VAVDARLDEAALASLGGWVELRIETAGAADAVRGRLNPAFRPGDPLIARPGRAATRDALIVEADRTAADLDRALIDALAAGGEVRLSVAEVADGRPAPGALVVSPGAEWGGRAPGDSGSAELHADWPRFRSPLAEADAADALEELDRGERVRLEAELARDPRAAALVAAASDAGHVVLPAPGLGPLAAALAVAGVDCSRTVVAAIDAPEARPSAWSGACVVVPEAPAGHVERWLAAFDAGSGARGAVGLDVGSRREEWLPWRAGTTLDVPGGTRRPAVAAIGASAGGEAQGTALPPAVELLARELIERGASTRELAGALERATGMGRNAAYEAALALARDPVDARPAPERRC
jgi:hypothetical protein